MERIALLVMLTLALPACVTNSKEMDASPTSSNAVQTLLWVEKRTRRWMREEPSSRAISASIFQPVAETVFRVSQRTKTPEFDRIVGKRFCRAQPTS